MSKFRKLISLIYIIIFSSLSISQVRESPGKIKVMTLGVFHFNFPNRDVVKINRKDQIDVLDPKYQKEIKNLVNMIAKFKPTIIAIERDRKLQPKIDSIYNKYLKGEYLLNRGEDEQIGFRLAKLLGISKLYCVNEWGEDYEYVNRFFENKDTIEIQKFMNYFEHSPDSLKRDNRKEIYATKGIVSELRKLNDENEIKKDLGDYLIGVFKYETKDREFFGVDFTTGWWFNRNLRIFRNIQKINAKPTDRILVIFGAGHMNILNTLFDCSPEYEFVSPESFLRKTKNK